MGAVVLVAMSCAPRLEDWGAVSGQALCERGQRCGTVAASVDCRRPGVWQHTLREHHDVDAGRLFFQPAAAARCLEQIEQASCGTWVEFLLSCIEVFQNDAGLDEPCVSGKISCGVGLRCAEFAECDASRCVAAGREGEVTNLLCAPPLDTGTAAATDGGVAFLCTRRSRFGESCGSARCESNLVCDNGRCAWPDNDWPVRRAEGEACGIRAVPPRGCLGGLACTFAQPNPVCVRAGQENEPCQQSSDCLSWRCVDGLCRAPLERGAPCEGSGCAAGLQCDGTCGLATCR